MLNFAANLTRLFNEVQFLDRFDSAARVGFKGVEFGYPYAFPRDEVAERLARLNLVAVMHNLPGGDWAAGERGIACLPDRVGEFQDGVETGISYAQSIGCKLLNCPIGHAPAGASAERLRETAVRNLRFAATALQREGMTLLVEPVNRYDEPAAYLTASQHALELMDATGCDNIRLLYDIYHMQRTEGELAATLQRHLPRIAHLQLADNPGRHEPGTGEINFPYLFRHLERIGYAGWIGCAYKPSRGTIDGMGWIEPWR